MLQLHHIRKSYTTADFTQVALDDVSIAFRDNEFVAILGPSGSGKTTLLNIVGGLDHYDSGDLVIDGVSTKDYRDRDWDTYRNNRIGFVFQSYNLITHQSVLANVELALTLSGVSRTQRRERALAALARVGLSDHVNKLPSQLSGGQMQRVAIARALINDPEIVLADEPTGALDSTTSVQIMGLLTEIARDRLVVMVTHNPELAEEYATRIVKVKDGIVAADSRPYAPDGGATHPAKPSRKTSMSFLTAVALSFTNLMTKKGRTLMTAFAGSIGIIGIAAILALANGVNAYIRSIEEDTLSVYPLTIQSQGLDFTSLMAASAEMNTPSSDSSEASGKVHEINMITSMFQSVGSNDLASLKTYLDDGGGGIPADAQSIQYTYGITPQIFTTTGGTVRQVNPDSSFSALGLGSSATTSSLLSSTMNTNVFHQLVDDTSMVATQYDVVAGSWPQSADQLVLVLTPSGGLSDFVAYAMGLRDASELDAMVQQMVNGEQITTPTDSPDFTYQQLMDVTFQAVSASSYYDYDSIYGVWTDKSSNADYLSRIIADGQTLHVSGIVQPKSSAKVTALQPGLYYTSALATSLITEATDSAVVRSQLADPSTDIFTGRTFADEAANPDQSAFDISSLLSVDEDTIRSAFTIDQSKLTIDPAALNITMPTLQIDPATLPELDLSTALGSIDLESLIGPIDSQKIIDSVDLSAVSLDIDPTTITDMGEELAMGFGAFCTVAGNDCAGDPQASFDQFLASSEGQALVGQFESEVSNISGQLDQAEEVIVGQIVDAISAQVRDQIAAGSVAITTRIQDSLKSALDTYMEQALAAVSTQIQNQVVASLQSEITQGMSTAISELAENFSSAVSVDQQKLLSAFSLSMSDEELSQLLVTMMSAEPSSLESNLTTLGYADFAKPAQIDIYPQDFDSKEKIISVLDSYNERMKAQGEESKVITYTDLVGTMMSSVTTIINVVSWVLVAFVAISLVVSSIMIGVITYISVLERKKEIGILRSIGASKRDIRWVFNAETLIVGLVAGLIGIGTTLILTIPANAIIYSKFGISNVAQLPWAAGIILVAISMGLTFLAGLIPSSAASRKDPVEALRSE